MTDKQLMIRLLTNLKFYLGELEKKKKVSSEEYKGNYDFQAIIERRLQKAIETCIDMGNHIISDENLRPAKGYRDVFNVLHENKIISEKLRDHLSDLASFRNVLVHEYADIDASNVYKKFKSSSKIFSEFMGIILKIIK